MTLPQENATWDELLTIILKFKAEYDKLPTDDESILTILEKEIEEHERLSEDLEKDSTDERTVDSVMVGTAEPDNEQTEPNLDQNIEKNSVNQETEPDTNQEKMELNLVEAPVYSKPDESVIESQIAEEAVMEVNTNESMGDGNSESQRIDSQQTCEAALMLLSFQHGVLEQPRKKIKKTEVKPTVDELIRQVSANLGKVSDNKAQYYEWKYTNTRNKNQLKAIAGASRGTSVSQMEVGKIPRARSLTPSLNKTPKQQKPFQFKFRT